MVSEHANPLADFGGPDAGGQNVHVAELAGALTRLGHDVVVYTRRDDPVAPRETTADAGYRVRLIAAGPAHPIPKDDIYEHIAQFTDELSGSFVADPPQLVHAHFWMSALAAELAAPVLRIPVVVTFHALGAVKREFLGTNDTSPRCRVAMETVIARHADTVVATCSEEVFALARMGVANDRTSIVPCGVDVAAFASDGPQSGDLGGRRARYRIVSVGRLVPRKGFDIAIDALALLPDAELVIVGGPRNGAVADDPEGARLLARAAALDIGDRLRMPGQIPRSEMPAMLRSADVVTCTPWYEPFGITPLEAMAAGTPVVATAVGGMLDTVCDGVTGDLVPPRDPPALAAALSSLLADAPRRAAYATAGAARVRSRYTWSRIADDTARIYDRLIRRQRAAPVHAAKG